jgi:xanthine dehydrogenase accessory factor
MRNPWAAIVRLLEHHGACAMVSLATLQGSGPREIGARMVVAPDGSFHGTIGGGTLEFEAIALAARLCGDREAADRLHLRNFTLGPDLGQCCGGRVGLALECFSKARLDEARRLAGLADAGILATRARIGAGGDVSPREIASAREAPAAAIALAAGLLEERFSGGETRLLLFGAGHVGRAVVLALASLPFRVSWIDSREDAFPARMPATVEARHLPVPTSVFSESVAGSDKAEVLVMTHDHALDFAIADAALRAPGVGGVGMIGSATKAARMLSRLRAGGHSEETLSRFRCPIGIAGIASKEPAAIAVSVAAELMIRRELAGAVHNKRDGRLAGGIRVV